MMMRLGGVVKQAMPIMVQETFCGFCLSFCHCHFGEKNFEYSPSLYCLSIQLMMMRLGGVVKQAMPILVKETFCGFCLSFCHCHFGEKNFEYSPSLYCQLVRAGFFIVAAYNKNTPPPHKIEATAAADSNSFVFKVEDTYILKLFKCFIPAMAPKKIPHFMNTIMNTNSRDKRLRVPKTFMDKHGKHLSDQIHLKLPGGSEWEVKLRRCAGEVWFEKGWPEFSEFCSLDLGSSLVFRYEGKSKFHVLIFDESGTEIEYPTTMPQTEETEEEEGENDDDVSVEEILETEEESDDMSIESLENETKESLEVVLIDDDDDVKSVESLEFFPVSQEKNRRHPHSSSKPSSSSSSSLRANVKAAGKFVSSHPFFKVTLGSSLTAHVPASFRKHFPQMKKQTLKLWIGDRSWHVTLNSYPQSYPFSAGWRAFSKANWLKEGDICVFELVDRKNVALEVKIFRC